MIIILEIKGEKIKRRKRRRGEKMTNTIRTTIKTIQKKSNIKNYNYDR